MLIPFIKKPAILLFSIGTFFIALLQTGCAPRKESTLMAPTFHEKQKISTSHKKSMTKNPSRVAMLLPLSGRQSGLGKALQYAAELSLFDHDDANLELSFYDTAGTPEGAEAAAHQALREGSAIIVGPVFSSSTQAITPIVIQKDVQVISFSNDETIARLGVFSFGFSSREQIQEILRYATLKRLNKVAVLIPQNAYGDLVKSEIDRYRRQLDEHQHQFEFITYSGDTTQLSSELSKIKHLTPNAIFIPEGGKILSRIISSLLYHEVALDGIQFLGTGQWDDVRTLDNRTLYGAIVATPDPKRRLAFTSKYEATYGKKPMRLATLSYDIISMLSVLRKHYPQNSFSRENLTVPRGFEGVDGIFRLNEAGVVERKLALACVTPQGLRVVQFAESQF